VSRRRPISFVAWALLLVLASGSLAAAEEAPVRIRIPAADRATFERVRGLVDVETRRPGDGIYATATPEGLAALAALGVEYVEAPDTCGSVIDMLTAAEVEQGGWNWAAHPTYGAYAARMQWYADTYPQLARRVVIGATTNTARPHQLLALKISDHPDTEEDEPEVLLTSSIHGDETTGYVLLLRLIDELLTHYDPASSDPYDQAITRLVDSVELWVNPLANPDGTYYTSDELLSPSASRRRYTNADGTTTGTPDGNRNFPDPQDGPHPDGLAYWTETQHWMAFGAARSFVLAANFHGGAEVFNYPWDTWSDGSPDYHPHADEAWYQGVAHHYADLVQANAPAAIGGTSYFTSVSADGTTNGWDWYEVQGGRQDWMNWFRRCRENTLEISDCKTDDSARMPDYWTAHRQALLDYVGTALTGIRGLVTDSHGTPLAATVQLAGSTAQEAEVLTDSAVGDYHRMLDPGSHGLTFSADGFDPLELDGIPVGAGEATRRDVVLLAPSEVAPLFADNFETRSTGRWSATVD